MIKIFATESASTEPTAHIFNFTAPSKARAELEAFVSALQQTIATKKAQVIARPRQTISDILANQDILNDSDLQESLLKSNIDLSTTFREAVINGSLSPAQFWSNRGPLLRAHAVEKGQQKGPYNVLATIKPKTVDNQLRVNMTREKIHDVFNQHPVLQEVYNENVPPLTEDQFWGRFFVSRLCKKLRGERILPADATDEKLDRYLNMPSDVPRKRIREESFPNVINIEGNEENNSKKQGNMPDFTMRPSKIPVVESINGLSRRILDTLQP